MEPAQNQILQQYPFPNTSVLFRTQLIISAFKVQSRIKPNKNPASWPLCRTDLPHRNPCIPSSADFPLYKTQFCSHPKKQVTQKKKKQVQNNHVRTPKRKRRYLRSPSHQKWQFRPPKLPEIFWALACPAKPTSPEPYICLQTAHMRKNWRQG